MRPIDYCRTHAISTKEFIDRVRGLAPMYSAATNSMCNNPAYGVVLASPIIRALGAAKTEHRRKPNKYTVRLANELSARFKTARRALGHNKQDAIEFAIRLYIANAARERATDGKEIEYTLYDSIAQDVPSVNMEDV